MKPKTLQDAVKYFSESENCMNWLKAKRWPDGVPVCPTCGRGDATYLPASQKWQCKSAHKSRQFSARVGTIFEDSPIPLEKWLVALWMVCNCKNGVSSYEIHRTVGVTQKSAWFMLHRLRLAMKAGSITKKGSGGVPVEVDETFVGGKAHNMHEDVRKRRITRRGAHDKAIVFGILERGGKVHAGTIPNRTTRTVAPILKAHVEDGANVVTDEATGYNSLHETYLHNVVNHAVEYVNGHVHTNGIENFWSLLKRGINGTYVAVEPFHLDRYVEEQVFRFNNRATKKQNVTDLDRFDMALTQTVGRRLTYAEVTGKVSPTCC